MWAEGSFGIMGTAITLITYGEMPLYYYHNAQTCSAVAAKHGPTGEQQCPG